MKTQTFIDKLFFAFFILVIGAILGLLLFIFDKAVKYDLLTEDVAFNKCITYLLETDQLQSMTLRNDFMEFTISNKSDFSQGVTYTNKIKGSSPRHAQGIFTQTYCPQNA